MGPASTGLGHRTFGGPHPIRIPHTLDGTNSLRNLTASFASSPLFSCSAADMFHEKTEAIRQGYPPTRTIHLPLLPTSPTMLHPAARTRTHVPRTPPEPLSPSISSLLPLGTSHQHNDYPNLIWKTTNGTGWDKDVCYHYFYSYLY